MNTQRLILLLAAFFLSSTLAIAQQSSFYLQGSVDASYTQFPFGDFDGEFHAEGAIDTSTFEPTDLQGVGGIIFPDSTGTETLFFAGIVVNPDTTLDALGMYLTAPSGFAEGNGSNQGITGVLFYLYRADSLDLPTDFDSVDVMDIIGLISAEHKFTGVPTGLSITTRTETELALTFGALAIDLDNNSLLISLSGGSASLEGLTVAVDESPVPLPASFRIAQVYPNPFNPTTRVELDFPRAAPATLALYNLLGERLRTLHQGTLPAGQHTLTLDAGELSSGTYLLNLETPESRDSRPITIVR
jgi:hypothetical protein